MQTIKLTKALAAEGLAEGDVLSVDEFSAAALIDRGDAEAYDPAAEAATTDSEPAEETKYGGQPAATIDDIVDPAVVRNKRVMTATIVGAVDAGPVRRSPDDNPADAPVEPDVPVEPETPEAVQSPTVKAANAKRAKAAASNSPELAASGAQPDGGDAGGGDAS